MRLLVLFSFIAVLGTYANGQKCPDIFRRYSTDHSYCKPANPNCQIEQASVSDADIALILKEHNLYRSKVASGKESGLPTAANMMQMVWDNDLAAVAQKHALQCVFEHDCNNCRRVFNFGVGQNIAEESMGGSTPPPPDWKKAVKMWYDEVSVFSKSYIDPFVAPPKEPTYGHFSQVTWAESWRIGCGYVLYKEGSKYKKMYTCNYGPAGNLKGGSMYQKGAACSNCPDNADCGSDYPGLCKITDDRGPIYKPQGSYIFYCDFNDQRDCDAHFTGTNKWLLYNTLSGNYISIALKGGEESTMIFNTNVKPKTSSFCFVTSFRKGPSIAGQQESNKAVETFSIVSQNFDSKTNLPSFGTEMSQQFSKFNMNLGWNMETQVKISFSVPAGAPDQFLEIDSLSAYEGKCKK